MDGHGHKKMKIGMQYFSEGGRGHNLCAFVAGTEIYILNKSDFSKDMLSP